MAPQAQWNGKVVYTFGASTGQPRSSYWAHADPVTAGGTGTRFFASDARGMGTVTALLAPIAFAAPILTVPTLTVVAPV